MNPVYVTDLTTFFFPGTGDEALNDFSSGEFEKEGILVDGFCDEEDVGFVADMEEDLVEVVCILEEVEM